MTRRVKKIVTVQRDFRRVALFGCLLLSLGFATLFRSNRPEPMKPTQKASTETAAPTAKTAAQEPATSLASLEPKVAYAAITPPAIAPTSHLTTVRKTIVVHFGYNRSSLSQKDKQRMLLEALPNSSQLRVTHITIVGHSDSDGREEYNYALSLKRAESVMLALGNIVETKECVSLKAVGSSNPIFVGDLEDRAASRRVEINLEYASSP